MCLVGSFKPDIVIAVRENWAAKQLPTPTSSRLRVFSDIISISFRTYSLLNKPLNFHLLGSVRPLHISNGLSYNTLKYSFRGARNLVASSFSARIILTPPGAKLSGIVLSLFASLKSIIRSSMVSATSPMADMLRISLAKPLTGRFPSKAGSSATTVSSIGANFSLAS